MKMKKEANVKLCVKFLPSSTASEHYFIQRNKVQLEEALLSSSLRAFSLKGSRNVGRWAGFILFCEQTGKRLTPQNDREETERGHSHLWSLSIFIFRFLYTTSICICSPTAQTCNSCVLADPTNLLKISQGCEREVVQVRGEVREDQKN